MFCGITLPLLMQHTIFSSLIPSDAIKGDLRQVAILLNIEMSHLLTSPKEKRTIDMQALSALIETSSVLFVDAALNGTHITNVMG